MPAAPFNTPVAWTNQDITLYHGTLTAHVPSLSKGINPLLGRSCTDFGIGFYTTTLLDQAKSWAWQAACRAVAAGNPTATGSVLVYTLNRERAAALDSLAFVRGDSDAEDFWSFVFHCRNGLPGHGRRLPGPAAKAVYDIVYGPVAAFWTQRALIAGADQISFHTLAAARLLVPQPALTITV